MSLRLLLADEGSSIKKAFEIALKDYQVEIKTVFQGSEVKEAFQSFQPNVCFFDVLLQKEDGYTACSYVKELSPRTPVVLMWSGFMELDQNRIVECRATDTLEKPFETETLRALISKHLPHLDSNEMHKFIVPDEVTGIQDAPPSDLPQEETNLGDLEDFYIAPVDEIEQPAAASPPSFDDLLEDTPLEDSPSEQETLETPDLLDLSPEPLSANTPTNDEEEPEMWTPPPLPSTPEKESSLPVATSEEPTPLETDLPLKDEKTPQTFTLEDTLSKEELKRLILAQSKDVIESVVWDVVPELAKEMIQKEIERLTGNLKYEGNLR